MPNYKVHDFSIILTLPLLAIPTWNYVDPVYATVITIAYIFGGYMLSPDLDIQSRIYKRWHMIRWIWKPYQIFVPHRSFLSHSGPVSATIRLLYLLFWLLPAIVPLFWLQIVSIPIYTLSLLLVCIWFGVVMSDIVHVLLDILF